MLNFELKRLAAKGEKAFMATLAEKVRATLALTAKEEKKKKKKKVEERVRRRARSKRKTRRTVRKRGRSRGRMRKGRWMLRCCRQQKKSLWLRMQFEWLRSIPRSSPCWANVEWLRVFRQVAMLTLPLTTASSMA